LLIRFWRASRSSIVIADNNITLNKRLAVPSHAGLWLDNLDSRSIAVGSRKQGTRKEVGVDYG